MRRHPVAAFLVVAFVIALVVGGALVMSGALEGTTPTRDGSRAVTPRAPVDSTALRSPSPRASSPAPSARRTPAPTPTAKPTPAHVGYVFPVGTCSATYGRTHHDYPAADIFAARDCAFVAPVDGVVDEVTRIDTWHSTTNLGAARGGRSVSLVGVDGVRYYGSHLDSVPSGVTPGLRVSAGQVLGRIGDSGSARGTGTHLHFAISWPTGPGHWWIRRGVVAPQPYLDAWRAGRDLSPAAAVATARREYGDDSRCHSYC